MFTDLHLLLPFILITLQITLYNIINILSRLMTINYVMMDGSHNLFTEKGSRLGIYHIRIPAKISHLLRQC